MFSVSQFVKDWGYVAVFLGSLVEGESVILTASALAAAGYLSIVRVTITAFIGTLIADQSLYFVGYFYGQQGIDFIKRKFPKMAEPMDRALLFLEKYSVMYIMAFRFIYSIRIISPIIIGAQKISFAKFSFLNFLSAVVWSVASCSLGYFIGEAVMHRSALFQKILLVVFVVIIATVVLYKKRKKRRGLDN